MIEGGRWWGLRRKHKLLLSLRSGLQINTNTINREVILILVQIAIKPRLQQYDDNDTDIDTNYIYSTTRWHHQYLQYQYDDDTDRDIDTNWSEIKIMTQQEAMLWWTRALSNIFRWIVIKYFTLRNIAIALYKWIAIRFRALDIHITTANRPISSKYLWNSANTTTGSPVRSSLAMHPKVIPGHASLDHPWPSIPKSSLATRPLPKIQQYLQKVRRHLPHTQIVPSSSRQQTFQDWACTAWSVMKYGRRFSCVKAT